jgi:two-component system sensor histidine kinase BaeS
VQVRHDAAGLRLEVSDTGPGVAPEDQPRVFERFYQAARHRELRGSSGLGLAIVRRVAELHGGRAGLRSRPGEGATFFIELPQAS